MESPACLRSVGHGLHHNQARLLFAHDRYCELSFKTCYTWEESSPNHRTCIYSSEHQLWSKSQIYFYFVVRIPWSLFKLLYVVRYVGRGLVLIQTPSQMQRRMNPNIIMHQQHLLLCIMCSSYITCNVEFFFPYCYKCAAHVFCSAVER